jgi:hypothetical protein
MKRRDRQVYRTEDAPDDLVEAILTAKPRTRTRRWDDEVRAGDDLRQLQALRDAAQLGLADIKAGRFEEFATREELKRHLERITSAAIQRGAKRRR